MEASPVKRITVNQVSKKFRIGFQKSDGILARVLTGLSGREKRKLIQVLDSVSFEVSAGEKIGLIGNNGSGKSTLLRIIAGIYEADGGQVITNGDVLYMNGFSLGLKPRLTMRDNIFLIGSIMGLGYREVKNNLNDIVEFAELQDYLDTKVYQFSSGMLSRLCFATTIHCLKQKKPEIILLDEVFGAGGDFAFQQKALAKMEEFVYSGAAVIIVSHQMEIISKYCDRAILLEKGKIKDSGESQRVVTAYLDNK